MPSFHEAQHTKAQITKHAGTAIAKSCKEVRPSFCKGGDSPGGGGAPPLMREFRGQGQGWGSLGFGFAVGWVHL